MIDDCDLQVGRTRELLPALRLLYHPRVFFIVAAHGTHMKDMLKLDFFGQQNKLSNSLLKEDVLYGTNRWAVTLGEAAFEKVFPIRNRWLLKKLSLGELLQSKFSGQQPFECILNGLTQIENMPPNSTFGPLGSYLATMAGGIDDLVGLNLTWTYRNGNQIVERVRAKKIQDRKSDSDISNVT